MFYSQKSYDDKLGTCSQTIKSAGCLITSCCNLFPRLINFNLEPPTLNNYCLKNNLYSNGCMLNLGALAKKFNLTYEKTTIKPKVTCIAETNYYQSKGVPQHFYMLKPDGTIIDPLDQEPYWEENIYNVVSYRVFKAIKKTTVEEVKTSEVVVTPETPKDDPVGQILASESIPAVKENWFLEILKLIRKFLNLL